MFVTKSGRIRKPATFLGFRKDKNPRQVVREIPKPINKVEQEIEEDEIKSTKPQVETKSRRNYKRVKTVIGENLKK